MAEVNNVDSCILLTVHEIRITFLCEDLVLMGTWLFLNV